MQLRRKLEAQEKIEMNECIDGTWNGEIKYSRIFLNRIQRYPSEIFGNHSAFLLHNCTTFLLQEHVLSPALKVSNSRYNSLVKGQVNFACVFPPWIGCLNKEEVEFSCTITATWLVCSRFLPLCFLRPVARFPESKVDCFVVSYIYIYWEGVKTCNKEGVHKLLKIPICTWISGSGCFINEISLYG